MSVRCPSQTPSDAAAERALEHCSRAGGRDFYGAWPAGAAAEQQQQQQHGGINITRD
jgi:hypothetical protein